jgi:hypothetical protein
VPMRFREHVEGREEGFRGRPMSNQGNVIVYERVVQGQRVDPCDQEQEKGGVFEARSQ